MLHTMMVHHKNKPLGMQSFLSRVNILTLNVFMAIAVFGTLLLVGLELFSPFGELGSLLASVLGLIVKHFQSGNI